MARAQLALPLRGRLEAQHKLALFFASLALGAVTSARADGDSEQQPEAAKQSYTRGLIELKRQATSRGTPEETTKTNLKLDFFLSDGPVSLLRLELPFPDEKKTLGGSALDPDFGDAKFRLGFRAFDVAERPVTSFVDLTFPTANPETQGTGKYQISGGLKTAWQLGREAQWLGSPRQSASVQVQQVVSFGGAADRKDINQTKLEFEWRDTWGPGHFAKAVVKPVVDWVGNGQTGAVLDVEGGWWIDPQWSLGLLVGGRLWGKGVPSTYEGRAELKLIYRY